PADQPDHILDGVALAKDALRHVASGGVCHLLILDMESGAREERDIADMVVVEMGQDDVLDLGGIDADEAQPLDWIAQKPALARGRRRRVEAEIDDEA